MRDLTALPKGHLHVHLEGAMRPSTLAELAAEQGLSIPATRGFGDFTAFVGMYRAASGLLDGEKPLRRLVREVVEDAAADGVVWIEPALYPTQHRATFGSDELTVDIVLDELAAAGEDLGVGAGLILAADRTGDPLAALELAALAVSRRHDGVVGFGLANDEVLGAAGEFAESFALAKSGGLLSVPHGGELVGPESVAACLDACGADRVQHGVRAIEDPDLVQRLASSGVCLDVCPTSNVALGVYPSLAEHPLPTLLEAGVRCSLNADDPLLFGPGVLEEYRLCRSALGLDDAQLAALARASIEASGAPAPLRAAALAGIAGWLDSGDGPCS